ncbi:MAG: diguanylate cyclase [Candidatus Aminicenantes bacterium]|jgi:diguanylate cyclase (GGDEF)-like protein
MLNISNLRESNAFLNVLLENLVSAVFVVDKNICIQSFNDSFKALFHKSEDKILGQLCGNALECAYTVEEGKNCGETSNCQHCTLRDSLLKAFTHKVPTYKAQLFRKFYINHQAITKYFLYSSKYVTYNNEGMVLVIVDDNTELMKASLKLKEMAITDGLTQLYNHKHSYYKLEEEITRATRYGNRLAVIMLDIDHFKAINDTYGHQIGDTTLVAVSQLIKDNLRDIDHVGRYGGEEFIVILPQTGLDNAYITAQRIRRAIESARFHEGKIKMTVSGGVVEFKEESALILIGKADELLYKAKQNGRNRIEK